MIEAITFPFRYFFDKNIDLFDDLKAPLVGEDRSVSAFIRMLPGIAVGAAYIFAIGLIIAFISSFGYKNQIDLIKELGLFGAVEKIFTVGNVGKYYNATFCIVEGALLLIALIGSLVDFYLHEKLWKRICTLLLATV